MPECCAAQADNVGKANLTYQHYRRVRILSTVSTPEIREHVLFVHAHPDDESISTGGTIATLLDASAGVTVITCTRGELGEVVPPDLQHLSGDALGEYRETELASAMAALRLTDFRFLGADGARADGTESHRFRDSGMQWGPDGAGPINAAPISAGPDAGGATLTSVDLDVVVADVVAVIAAVQPTAVVSYDAHGGYGHPDHIRAHAAASTAALLMNLPFYTIVSDGHAGPHGGPDDLVVDVTPVMERKKAALRAYSTQLTVVGDTIVHSGGQVQAMSGVEAFHRVGEAGQPTLEWDNLALSTKIVACALAAVVGAVVGAVGTANHVYGAATYSLLLVTALLIGLRFMFSTRIVAFCAAAGVVVVVGALSLEGAGGSVLVQGSTIGLVWAYAPVAIAVIVLAWPRSFRRSRATMENNSDPGRAVDAL